MPTVDPFTSTVRAEDSPRSGPVTADEEIADLRRRFRSSRAITEALSAPLSDSDQTVQSMPDASPTKWHRAHTTWFFEEFVLGPHSVGYERFSDGYGLLFNSYYETVGDRYPRARRGMMSRPGSTEIAEYRRWVDKAIEDLLATGASSGVTALIELGVNHEQQHQELLMIDAKHMLFNNLFDNAYRARVHRPLPSSGPVNWVTFGGGLIEIGHDALLWLSDGWHTRQADGWTAPLYWLEGTDGEWAVHTLSGERPVDPNEPVCHVSFYEADAFANWAGARLPTEFEWEHAAGKVGASNEGNFLVSPDDLASNVVVDSPLQPKPADLSTGELRQMFGDCWEWTGSPYRPYPRYVTPDGAIGEYNGKFMINTIVLRGGSALTPAGHHRRTYRDFFHPHTRWHLSGVRLARS